MSSRYNPSNWYWVVAGSTSQVYSSAAVAYVAPTDPIYLAWLAKGNKPTRIAVEQDLFDLLFAAGVAIPASATASDSQKVAILNSVDRTLFKILFNHENRIRTLAGQAQITKAQFIAAVKSLM